MRNKRNKIVSQLIEFAQQLLFLLESPSLILFHRQLVANKDHVGEQRREKRRDRRNPKIVRVKDPQRQRGRSEPQPDQKDKRHRLRVIGHDQNREKQDQE